MNTYNINSILNFGDHKGKSITQIFESNPQYLEWCVLNIPDFHLPQKEFDKLILKNLKYELPEEVINVILEKDDYYEEMSREWQNEKAFDKMNKDFYRDMKEEGWDPEID